MEGVTFGDVDEYIPESRDNVLSVSLSPHEFIEIRWDEGDRGAVHLLEASLRARPVGLDVIRAGPRYWIDKMLVVVHHLMVVESMAHVEGPVGCLSI